MYPMIMYMVSLIMAQFYMIYYLYFIIAIQFVASPWTVRSKFRLGIYIYVTGNIYLLYAIIFNIPFGLVLRSPRLDKASVLSLSNLLSILVAPYSLVHESKYNPFFCSFECLLTIYDAHCRHRSPSKSPYHRHFFVVRLPEAR
jgi:hypothetical protein